MDLRAWWYKVVRLEHLEACNFRNYEELSIDFEPGVNLIVGDNAQGKTNLLESIAYLGAGKAFRTQKSAELVKLGAEFAEIQGNVFSQQRNQSLLTVTTIIL